MDEDLKIPPALAEMGEEVIIDQVQREYELCWEFLRPKLEEWLTRLTIYNNQKRDKKKIGDPLLFTVFQTLLASLYNDTLGVKFLPREEGDVDRSENNNELAKFDYREMQKSEMDYEWDWDALFFGAGLVYFNEFDRKRMTPVPEVIDPCTFLRDPNAIAPNGDNKGFNALRFWGREIGLAKWELQKNKNYFNIDNLKKGRELRSLLAQAKDKRRAAQGLGQLTPDKEDTGENGQYDILEWFTHLNGKKYLVALGNAKTELVRVTELKEDRWPLIKRNLFPTAHDWDGVSVPDLTEDKQRARAVLQNLILTAAKDDAKPKMAIAKDRIINMGDLNGDYVRVKGESADGALAPIIKNGLTNKVQWIMDLLDQSAQRALATPEIQQGMAQQGAQTLGELEIMTAKIDTRNSLAVKIWGWSEREFWRQWAYLYKTHFKDGIDEKISRIIGPWGPEFNPLKRGDIVFNSDPDIEIESTQLANSQRLMERNAFTGFMGLVGANLQGYSLRFAQKKFAELNGMTRSQIKVLFPPTLDEMDAEAENKMIEKGDKPVVEAQEDDNTHILIHSRLPEGKLRDSHIEAHKFAMMQKKIQELTSPQSMGMAQPQQQSRSSVNISQQAPAQKATQTPIPDTYGGQ